MKKSVSTACVAMLGSGLAQAGGQPTEAGQATLAQEGSASAPAATSAFRLGPAAQARQAAAAEENMRQVAISRANDTGQHRLSTGGKPVSGREAPDRNGGNAGDIPERQPDLYGLARFSANTQLCVFGNKLLVQNDDTARFVTVAEVYTATQARTYATVGVRPEPKLR